MDTIILEKIIYSLAKYSNFKNYLDNPVKWNSDDI